MLYILVLIPVLIGLFTISFIKTDARKWIILSQAAIVLYASYLFSMVRREGAIINSLGPQPRPLAITLYADRLSMPLVLVTTLLVLGFLIYIYHSDFFTSRFTFSFMVLEALIIGLFFTTDLFNTYVLLEVSTIVVALLIMYYRDKQGVYDGMVYLFISVVASSFWLFGTGILYRTFGLLDFMAIQEVIGQVEDVRALILPIGMLLATVCLKIGLFPLSGWLPIAYGTPSAPPVVPAILSGIYEMLGIYLFICITAVYSQVIELNTFFIILGAMTAIIGFIFAIGQDDIRLLLAYSTISQVGLIILGLSFGSEESYWGSIFHMVAHSLFKSVLFLSAGDLAYYYETRNLSNIKGVMKKLPITGWAIILGVLGITGAPFFNGSISKLMIGYNTDSQFFQLLLNFISLGTMMYSIKLLKVLFGKGNYFKEKKKKHNLSQWVTLAFGIATILTGVFGNFFLEFFFGFSFNITFQEYLNKTFVYLLLVLAAYALYRGWVKEKDLFAKLNHIELSFNAMVTALVVFFIGIVGYMYVLV